MKQLPADISREIITRSVDAVIRERRTIKVIAPADQIHRPNTLPPENSSEVLAFNEQVRQSVSVAGWAPFHFDRKMNSIPEPWRMHILFRKSARQLASELPRIAPDMKPNNKVPGMLIACGATVIVTWLPEPNPQRDAKIESVNCEHLAAASAAVQNLLIALEARGMGTYWSSGGTLRDRPVMQHLKLEDYEQLLASVFIEYPDSSDQPLWERLPGNHRTARTPSTRWSRDVEFD
jgi:nitroreductase